MDVRSAILLASAEALTHDGALYYSVRQVAKRAGVRVGHLQHYFPTKNDLLLATTKEMCTLAHHRLKSPLRLGQTPAQQAKSIVAQIFSDLDTPQGSTAIWEIWALASHQPAIASVLADFYRKLRRVFVQLLARARPQLDEQRHQSLAGCLVALVEGSGALVAHNRIIENNLENLRAEIFQLIDQVFTQT